MKKKTIVICGLLSVFVYGCGTLGVAKTEPSCETITPEFIQATELAMDDADIKLDTFEKLFVGDGVNAKRCIYTWKQEGLKYQQGRLTINFLNKDANPETTTDQAHQRFLDKALEKDQDSDILSVEKLGQKAKWVVESETLVFNTKLNSISVQFIGGNTNEESLDYAIIIAEEIASKTK